MDWAEKIRCIEAKLGIENERGRLANILGIRPGIISDIKSGRSKNPGSDITLLLINKLGVNPEWLDKEIQPILLFENELKTQPFAEKFLHQKVENATSPPSPDTPADGTMEAPQKEALVVVDGGVEQGVLIPVIAQGLSAGLGLDYEEGEIVRYVKIPAWLARRSQELVAMPIYGESMEPTLSNGDLAVCGPGGFCGDGVYMLRDEQRGVMFCKRVIWAPGGWTIVSDNAKYEPMKVDDRSIEIVARVIAAIKEVK